MALIQIDTRGLSCPQPVVMVQQELKNGNGDFEILLDSEASKENVLRILNKFHMQVDIVSSNDETTIYKVRR